MTEQLPLDLVEERTWSVREFALSLHQLVQSAHPDELWLHGELRNRRSVERDGKRNLFFDLVEPGAGLHDQAEAAVHVVLWDGERRAVNATLSAAGPTIRMEEGVELRIRGQAQWWIRRGDLRLRMTGIDPVFTLGRLSADRDRLLAELAAAGLLDANGKLPIAAVPLRVGLVTAQGSAAEADVLREFEQSGFGFSVVTVDAAVQGPSAPGAVVAALRTLGRRSVDVILLARGGGARTDLAAFDHPLVARAVAACSVPVFTGIGHEIDRSVVDDVAHTACKTPTGAAAQIVTLVRKASEGIERQWQRVADATATRFAAEQLHLDRAGAQTATRVGASLERASMRRREREARTTTAARHGLHRHRQRVDEHADAVPLRAKSVLARARQEADGTERHVQLLDPDRLLARGWSITRTASGGLVRSASDVATGVSLVTTVAEGRIHSRVEASEESPDD
ncbi:MAG: exodeoxyribonuclease VII large subunit [Acidimicrobiales bacterium]